MNARERVHNAIHHRQPDRIPLDLGATGQTGISASTLYRLRRALGLEEHPVSISEPFQLLGGVEEDLRAALGVDVVGIGNPNNMFGVANEPQRPFAMSDGTPVLLAERMACDVEADGSVYAYPQGDRRAARCAKIPAGGFFFDNLDRAPDFDEDNLTPLEDFAQAFGVLSDADAAAIQKQADALYRNTEYALIGNLGGGGLGDAAMVPGPHETAPRGIRKFEDWLMAHLLYPEYVRAVFAMQTEVMLKNLEIYRQAVGDRIQIIWISGTDFGTQNGGFLPREVFVELYKPFYRRINDWVHANTSWKTFYHSCGSVVDYLDDFVDMGVDILNPVQLSAHGMDAAALKRQYGDRLVFWGGGVDTQGTLPFGTPQEVRKQVLERLELLSAGGGYVCAAIHNIVAKTPMENLLAFFEAHREFNGII